MVNDERNQNATSQFQLRDLQLIMLENMKIIHALCEKHNIKYSLCSGSAIGGVVHKGFIPWDDDIDIMMDRENYDLFCKIIPNELPDNLKLLNYKNSSDARTLISKIVDNNYLITYETTTGEKIDMGLFIDITVLDKVPTDVKKRKNIFRKSKLGLLLIGRNAPQNQGKIAKIVGTLLIKMTSERFKINFGKKTEYLVANSVKDEKEYTYAELLIYCGKMYEFDKQLFSQYELVHFEDTYFYIVSDYDRYLKKRYERDYTILPPKEQQVPHHGILGVKKVN